MFLVVLEQGRFGCFLGYFLDYDIALAFCEEAFSAAQEGRIWEYMEQKGRGNTPTVTYSINGNCTYLGKIKFAQSDGHNSVSVVKINPKNFSVKQFIKERENSSYLLDSFKDDVEDEHISEFQDIFTWESLWAN
jgi:hypothetical protein